MGSRQRARKRDAQGRGREGRPDIIVLDEPTTLLDLWNKRKFMAAIDALDEHVVIVSHDLDLLEHFDRVLHIEDGAIAGDDRPGPVLASYVAGSQC